MKQKQAEEDRREEAGPSQVVFQGQAKLCSSVFNCINSNWEKEKEAEEVEANKMLYVCMKLPCAQLKRLRVNATQCCSCSRLGKKLCPSQKSSQIMPGLPIINTYFHFFILLLPGKLLMTLFQ